MEDSQAESRGWSPAQPRTQRSACPRGVRMLHEETLHGRSICRQRKTAKAVQREHTVSHAPRRGRLDISNAFAPGMVRPQRTRLPRATASRQCLTVLTYMPRQIEMLKKRVGGAKRTAYRARTGLASARAPTSGASRPDPRRSSAAAQASSVSGSRQAEVWPPDRAASHDAIVTSSALRKKSHS